MTPWDQHPDAARFVVNGIEKSPDGGAVPCKAPRACMSKYLGRSCTLQEVAAMEAIAAFQYGMTYENRFGSGGVRQRPDRAGRGGAVPAD